MESDGAGNGRLPIAKEIFMQCCVQKTFAIIFRQKVPPRRQATFIKSRYLLNSLLHNLNCLLQKEHQKSSIANRQSQILFQGFLPRP